MKLYVKFYLLYIVQSKFEPAMQPALCTPQRIALEPHRHYPCPRHCHYVASPQFISDELATTALIHRRTLVNFIRSRYVLTANYLACYN